MFRPRAAAAPLLLLAVVVALAATVSAHASLEEAVPEPNRRVEAAPSELTLLFTEPIEAEYTRIEVRDGNGSLRNLDWRWSGPDAMRVEVPLLPLSDGLYEVHWRVLGVDGHTEGGAYYLAVNASLAAVDPEALDATAAASATADHGAHDQAIIGGAVAVGNALAAGMPVFVLLVGRRVIPEARWRGVERVAAGAAAAAAVALVIQYVSFAQAVALTFADAVGTRAGAALLARAALLAATVLLLVLAASRGRGQPSPALEAVAGGVAFVALAAATATSHAAVYPEGWVVAVALDWLHQAAVAVWVGGVAVLLGLATFRAPRERMRAALLRFSPVAAASAGVVLATGLYATQRYLPDAAAFTGTEYGRILLAKIALFIAVLLLAIGTRYVIAPRLLRSGTERSLARLEMLLLAELTTMALILTLVAILVGTDTPTAPGAG